MADPTTSLPERIGGQRNWDYRLNEAARRRACPAALRPPGFTSEAEGFIRFVQHNLAGRASDLQVLLGIQGNAACPSRASSI